MTKGKPLNGKKNPGGRPTEWTDERIDQFAERLIKWTKSHTSCYLETFCKLADTYPQKLTELAAKSEKFSEALKKARASCASNLAEATAGGEMPPAFGIFALKQHGWSDKHEIAQTGNVDVTHKGKIDFVVDVSKLADLLNGISAE
jgi:hypothetical protein